MGLVFEPLWIFILPGRMLEPTVESTKPLNWLKNTTTTSRGVCKQAKRDKNYADNKLQLLSQTE